MNMNKKTSRFDYLVKLGSKSVRVIKSDNLFIIQTINNRQGNATKWQLNSAQRQRLGEKDANNRLALKGQI